MEIRRTVNYRLLTKGLIVQIRTTSRSYVQCALVAIKPFKKPNEVVYG